MTKKRRWFIIFRKFSVFQNIFFKKIHLKKEPFFSVFKQKLKGLGN